MHIQTSNNEIMIIVQFETKEAIENLDEILKLKEIDVVLIGSLDLSQSLGYPGEVDNPIVKDIIKKAIKKIVNAGKAAGIVAASPNAIKYWFDLGVKFITYHQTYIIREALENHKRMWSIQFLSEFITPGNPYLQSFHEDLFLRFFTDRPNS